MIISLSKQRRNKTKWGDKVVKQRSVGVAIILTLITCGLYSIYWMYALTNEVSVLSKEPSFSGGKVILLTIVTCGIYGYFWMYQLGRNIEQAQQHKGIQAKDNGLMFLVLTIFGLGIVSYAIAQSDVNKLVEQQ